jgi:hypothetical protein
VIGGVEPGSLEDDTHREVELSQGLFAALRANRQGRIVEVLVLLELDAAAFAAVGVDGHQFLQAQSDYSPPTGFRQGSDPLRLPGSTIEYTNRVLVGG